MTLATADQALRITPVQATCRNRAISLFITTLVMQLRIITLISLYHHQPGCQRILVVTNPVLMNRITPTVQKPTRLPTPQLVRVDQLFPPKPGAGIMMMELLATSHQTINKVRKL